jgi:hypothetical protein
MPLRATRRGRAPVASSSVSARATRGLTELQQGKRRLGTPGHERWITTAPRLEAPPGLEQLFEAARQVASQHAQPRTTASQRVDGLALEGDAGAMDGFAAVLGNEQRSAGQRLGGAELEQQIDPLVGVGWLGERSAEIRDRVFGCAAGTGAARGLAQVVDSNSVGARRN